MALVHQECISASSPDQTAARPLALHTIQAKTVLNRMRPFRSGSDNETRHFASWSINPYRGCQHACAYCYARRTHIAFDLDGGRAFEQEIFVKENAALVLREQLRHRRHAAWEQPIVIGSAVDPYQPVEGKQQITRSILKVLRDYKAPVTIITKNSMIVRDIDILSTIAQQNYCAVFMSITTMDADLARRLEPATPPPQQRLRAIQRLVKSGIPAGVMLAPVMPWLTDGTGMLEQVALEACHHSAQWLTSGVLRLHPDVKPWFFEWLGNERKDLLPAYERWYVRADPPQLYHDRVHNRVETIRASLGLANGPKDYVPRHAQQMALF